MSGQTPNPPAEPSPPRPSTRSPLCPDSLAKLLTHGPPGWTSTCVRFVRETAAAQNRPGSGLRSAGLCPLRFSPTAPVRECVPLPRPRDSARLGGKPGPDRAYPDRIAAGRPPLPGGVPGWGGAAPTWRRKSRCSRERLAAPEKGGSAAPTPPRPPPAQSGG